MVCWCQVFISIYQINTRQSIVHYRMSIFIINYVSEHQLPHAANASHITPTTQKALAAGWRKREEKD